MMNYEITDAVALLVGYNENGELVVKEQTLPLSKVVKWVDENERGNE